MATGEDRRPPTRGRRTRAAALGVATVLLLAGVAACSDDDDEPTATSRPTGTTTADEVVGAGDRYEATIRRGTGGVPHVTGATITDAAFGQGYASGEDHTCDLADQFGKIKG